MYSEITAPNQLRGGGYRSVQIGASVEFELKKNPMNGKPNAFNVTGPKGGDLEESYEQQAFKVAAARKAGKS